MRPSCLSAIASRTRRLPDRALGAPDGQTAAKATYLGATLSWVMQCVLSHVLPFHVASTYMQPCTVLVGAMAHGLTHSCTTSHDAPPEHSRVIILHVYSMSDHTVAQILHIDTASDHSLTMVHAPLFRPWCSCSHNHVLYIRSAVPHPHRHALPMTINVTMVTRMMRDTPSHA